MPGTVAVTGATGFIGRVLLKNLTTSGWKVNALTRRPQDPSDNINWITGSVQDPLALDNLVADVNAVIHCAGQVRGRSQADFNLTNVTGTENILRASERIMPHPKVLILSSLAAREAELSWYAKSKFLAEQVTADYAGKLSCTIYRPTAVYGPGDKELSPLFRISRLGFLPSIGNTSNRISLIHVDDLVKAIITWLNSDRALSGVFELDDGRAEGYDYQTLAKLTGHVWNRPVKVLAIPVPLVNIFAHINLFLARIFKYSPMLTPGKVREIQHPDWLCDNKPLERATGWKPAIDLSDALPASI